MSLAQDTVARLNHLGSRLIAELFQLARNARVHQADNVVFSAMGEELARLVDAGHEMDQELLLRFVHDTVFLNDLRIKLDPSLFGCARHLARELQQRELGGLGFVRGAAPAALRADLYHLFHAWRPPAGSAVFTTITLLPPATDQERMQQQSEDVRDEALHAYGNAVYFLRVFFQGIRRNKPPKVGVARRVVNDLIDVSEHDAQRFLNLCSIKDLESRVQTHSVNTAVLAIGIGQTLGLSRAALAELGLCALFHEIGLAFLPDALQDGQHALSGHDRMLLEQQPLAAARALLSSMGLSEQALTRVVVAYEHCRPHREHRVQRAAGGPGHALFSRVVRVCHAFDDLTRYVHGRAPLLPDEALASMVADGGELLDPVLVRMLVNLVGLYPVGTAVQLASGETAVVYYAPVDPRFLDRPVVKVIRDAQGAPCRHRVVDLSRADASGQFPPAILRTLPAEHLEQGPLPLLFS